MISGQLATPINRTDMLSTRTDDKLRSLIPIQIGDQSRLPFFWMHSSDFTFLRPYFEPTQPFYCIMPSGMNPGEDILCTQDEIVDYHIGVIQALQPRGPYLLGGYCNGGKNAVAIALRLTELGHDVRLLALVDVPVLDEEQKMYFERPWHIRMLGLALEGRLWIVLKEIIRKQIEKFTDRTPHTPEIQRLKDIVTAHDQVFDRYVMPRAFPGRITLFVSEDAHSRKKFKTEKRWGQLATDGMQYNVIPGNHITMIRQPNIQCLGELLMQAITDAQNRRS